MCLVLFYPFYSATWEKKQHMWGLISPAASYHAVTASPSVRSSLVFCAEASTLWADLRNGKLNRYPETEII